MRWVSIINQARGRSGRARAGGIALCVAAVVGAGTLAACGSSDDNGNTSTGASTGAAAASTPAETTSGSTSTPAAAESAGVTDYVKYVGGTAGAADSSKSPIVIGFVNQQGGANDVGPGATDGAKLAVEYVNKYAGGIDGHPVALHTCFISTAEEQGQQKRHSGEYGSLIIHSIETGQPRVIYGNVNNQGLIDNLPQGCCVEVPVLVDKSGLQPTRIGALPPQLAAMMQTNINVQSLTVEAALTSIYRKLGVSSRSEAVELLAELNRR